MTNAIYGQRVADVRKKLGLSQRSFGEKMSRSQGFISDIESGRTDPSFDFLVKLWTTCGVDPGWVITGQDGQEVAHPGFVGRTTDITPPDITLPAHGDVSIGGVEFTRIRVFDVRVSAGRGQLVPSDDVIDEISFTRSWLLRLGVNADLCGLVEVRGDSMAPHIRNGALVLVHFAEMEVINGLIYAFTLGDELFLKRLTRIEGGWLITADNPAYPPLQVMGADANMLQVHGRIRAAIDKF
jgi:phage repressor protein C with HTH and peptisase S24 domain